MNGLRKIIRRAKLRRHTVMARRFVQKRKVVEHEVNEVDYKVDYQPGEPAEFGYNDTHKFPKEWVPWRNVLNMDFSLLGVAGFLWLSKKNYMTLNLFLKKKKKLFFPKKKLNFSF